MNKICDSSLTGKICLVTGASRGIGKGIALKLGEANAAKIYITGRTLKCNLEQPGCSLEEVENEINMKSLGNCKCIAIQCDHSNDNDVRNLFDRISKENNGVLNLLVNNAYSYNERLLVEKNKHEFWKHDRPEKHWDLVNNVGLRNHYICSAYAAKLMVVCKTGLIINISSASSKFSYYLYDVAFGAGKAAVDRMSADCAIDLKPYNVACFSFCCGPVKTELVEKFFEKMDETNKKVFEKAKPIEYIGSCIVSLAADKDIIKKTGKILCCSEVASEYGITCSE